MRFIGEIYVKDLVKAAIMCYCVEQVPTPSPIYDLYLGPLSTLI